MYRMTIDFPGNPDFGERAPIAPRVILKKKTLVELRSEVRRCIEHAAAGSGNFSPSNVFDGANDTGLRFSYNGRLWRGQWPNAVEVTP